MTFFEFWASRRAERRARKADRAMLAAWGQSWLVNRDGICQLLTAPTPLVVLDVGMLRGVVPEALAVTEEQALSPSPAEPVYGAEEPEESLIRVKHSAAETFPVEPLTAEVSAEPHVEERSNGVEAAPVRQNMMYDDDRRRAFLRTFFREQRPVRGPVVPTR